MSTQLTATQKISLVASSFPVIYLFPTAAEAAAIYKDSSNAFSVSFNGPTSVEWDVDGDGTNDFLLHTSNFNTTNNAYNTAGIFLDSYGRAGQGVVRQDANAGNTRAMQNLAIGFVVGPTLAAGYGFGSAGQSYREMLYRVVTVTNSSPVYSVVGQDLIDGVPGSNFIGFRFNSAGQTLYGWAEVILAPETLTIRQWAYNDTADGSVTVTNIPENSSPLALLAMGAAGVYRWRKQRHANKQ